MKKCNACDRTLDSTEFTGRYNKCKSCRAQEVKEKRRTEVQEKLIGDSKLAKSIANALSDDTAYFDKTLVRKLPYVKPYYFYFKTYLSLSKKIPGCKDYNKKVNDYNKDLFVLLQKNSKSKNLAKLVGAQNSAFTANKIDLDSSDFSKLLKHYNGILEEYSEITKEMKKNKYLESDSESDTDPISKYDSDSEQNRNNEASSSSSKELKKKKSKPKKNYDEISAMSDLSDEEETVEETSPKSKLKSEISDLIDLLKVLSFSSADKKREDRANEKVAEMLRILKSNINSLA